MKPEQTACTSKAAPRVMPSRAWTMVAVAGKVSSGVVVAQMIDVELARIDAGIRQRRARRRQREIGGLLAVRDDAALADAGALADPFVGGIDALGEIVIGDDRSPADRRRSRSRASGS